MYSVGLYADLRRETGKDPGWHEVGGLRLASSPERMEELRRQAGWAESFGLPLDLVSAADAQARFPLMSIEGVLGAAWLPRDGYLDPSQLTFALADGARRYGAEIETRTKVTRSTLRNGRVHEVVTDKGTIRTDVVVNAGGMAAPDVARLVGVNVPIITMAHQYLVTEPFAPPLEPLPTLRDPDNLVYFRTEVGGLVMGGYERDPAPFGLDGIPEGFEAQLLTEDWERFEDLMAGAVLRVPAIEGAEVKRFFNGPEAFTPDGEFILGESEVPGFWVAAGFCAHGLAGAGGIGKVMAEWIVDGEPGVRPLAHGHPPLRRALSLAALRPRPHDRGLLQLLRHPLSRARSGRRDGRCACPPPIRGCRSSAPSSARSRAGSASTGSSRMRRTGDESLRPRGWAGPHLVAGDRGRVPRSARHGRRCSTSRRSRRSTCTGPARSPSSRASARTRSTGRSARSSTPSS